MITGEQILPTTTAHQARCQVFQATRRPKHLEGLIINSSWGEVKITGRLGQGHADVLEAIMRNAEKYRTRDTGAVQLFVDPYKIRMTAGGGKQMSGQQLKVILDDLMTALVELRVPAKNLDLTGHILDEIDRSPHTRHDPLTGKERFMIRVTVARAWVTLINRDLGLTYEPVLVAALSNGISQAVARHVLTHSNTPPGGWKIPELLLAVGGMGRERDQRKFLSEDEAGLAKLGVVIEGARITKSSARPTARQVRPTAR